jgi:Uma2 family endonuclease
MLIDSQSSDSPQRPRLSRAAYCQMAAMGWFEGKRVELVDGEVVLMGAQTNSHVLGVSRAAEALQKVFGSEFWVRVQAPLDLAEDSDPVPDLAVVSGHMREYKAHQQSAILVVEVADTTLHFVRGRKAALYARAGIQDYWIVDLVDDQLELLRQPVVDATSAHYSSIMTLRRNEVVNPLALWSAAIAVADLLP